MSRRGPAAIASAADSTSGSPEGSELRADLAAAAEGLVRAALGPAFTAAQLEVRWRGRPLLSGAWGGLDPEGSGGPPCTAATRFDLASVTKLFTTAAFLRLVEAGLVGLDDPVATVLPEFSGPRGLEAYEDPARPGAFLDLRGAPPHGAAGASAPPPFAALDAAGVAFRALLSHSSGLPPWLPLAWTGSPEAARAAALASPFAYSPGTKVAYSDLGFILLGLAVERLAGRPLDEAMAELVLEPLGLVETGYRPLAAWPTEPGAAAPCTLAG